MNRPRTWGRIGQLNLRTKVTLLLLALSLGPLLVAGLVNVNRAVDGGKRAARARYAQAAQFGARNLEGLFDRAQRSARRLARTFPVESFDFDAAARAVALGQLQPSVSGWREPEALVGGDADFSVLFAALPNGHVFYVHPFHNVPRPPDLSGEAWFTEIATRHGIALGSIPPLTEPGSNALVAVSPILRSGQVVGWVGALLSGARLHELATISRGTEQQDRRTLLLVDRAGRVAADTAGLSRELHLEAFARLRGVGTTEVELAGDRVLVARAPVGQTGWQVQLVVHRDRAFRSVYGLIWVLIIVIVLTFFFVLLFADHLATVLLQPIRELEHGAEMFGRGALEFRIDMEQHANDELGLLASAFNQMGDRLLRSKKEVEAYSRNLETANQELDAMVYAITHDLKRALRGIEAFATFIEEDYGGKLDDEGVEYVHGIVGNVDRINQLADDLIRLVEQEREKREPTSFSLQEVLTEARERALEREGRGDVNIAPGMPDVLADRAQILLVFDNLITNGLKFNTTDNPRVWVTCTDDGPYWRIEVRDDGIGIEPRYQDRVFELFARLNHADEFPGTGTGLNLSRRIVEDHRGSLYVDSTPGKGSTFSVLLPKDPGLLTSPSIEIPALGT